MKFIGTRGGEKATGTAACMRGFAANGGLFVPEKLPKITENEFAELLDMSYPERAAKITAKFFDEPNEKELLSAFENTFSAFEGADPVPLVRLDEGVYMLELFHGPTCSFKDISLSLLPLVAEKIRKGGKVLVIAASSADTDKAALEYFKEKVGYSVAAFYPCEGVSKLQKIHLTTQDGKNVFVAGVKGSADDCFYAVKNIFLKERHIFEEKGVIPISADAENIATLVPELAYFFSAYCDLVSSSQIEAGEEIDFTLPAGSLGNAVAALYAKKMGLPVRRIHCASNQNKTLADFFKTGVYDINREIVKTTSPSMDLLLAVNLERLLFEVFDRNYKLTAKKMTELEERGSFALSDAEKAKLNEVFDGGFASEEDGVEAMYDVFVDTGYTMDPHTGCAMKVAVDWFERNKKDETKTVILATANPYKFPQDVLYAVTGNDVKDSFKGVKRLHAATAMSVPKQLKELRDKSPVFTKSVDRKKILAELEAYLHGVS